MNNKQPKVVGAGTPVNKEYWKSKAASNSSCTFLERNPWLRQATNSCNGSRASQTDGYRLLITTGKFHLKIINISQGIYSVFIFCESLVFLAYDRAKNTSKAQVSGFDRLGWQRLTSVAVNGSNTTLWRLNVPNLFDFSIMKTIFYEHQHNAIG